MWKSGDIVTCIDTCIDTDFMYNTYRLKNGEQYIIKDISCDSDGLIAYINIKESPYRYSAERFIKYNYRKEKILKIKERINASR